MLGETGQPCGIPPLFGAPCFIPTLILPLGLAGEGETGYAEEDALPTGGRPFPEDHAHPQRGNMVGSAPASVSPRVSWEALEKHVAPSPQGLRSSVDVFLSAERCSRNGSEVWDWILHGRQLLLFSYLSGLPGAC